MALATFVDDREFLITAACRIVENRDIAEELVQESWLRWSEKNYRHCDARPIFYRIVSNLALDWVRRGRTERIALGLGVFDSNDTRDGERFVMARQELDVIVKTLYSLPPRVSQAFRMNRLHGMTYADIAKKLDTVPSRAHGYVAKALAAIALELMD
ncbi:MAG: sigma-70 family RNA polymerase sigma factor [Pseudomonadota bacterium]